MRPENLIYAVDERPPTLRLAALGIQYAVYVSVYMVIVVIILRHAHVSQEIGTNVLCVASAAIAVGAVLQALHKVRSARAILHRRYSPRFISRHPFWRPRLADYLWYSE